MIALCQNHHAQAEGGAFTAEQLRSMKKSTPPEDVKGRFSWMRNNLVVVAGNGVLFYQNPVLLQVSGQDAVWINRDQDGHLLLNIDNLPLGGRTGDLTLHNNDWTAFNRTRLQDLLSPPGGRSLDVRYQNGDRLYLEFVDHSSLSSFATASPTWAPAANDLLFPITAVTLLLKASHLHLDFNSQEFSAYGGSMVNCVVSNNRVGIAI
jgi:hypothetical protein